MIPSFCRAVPRRSDAIFPVRESVSSTRATSRSRPTPRRSRPRSATSSHADSQISGGVSGTMLEISLKNCHDAGDLTGIERFLSSAAGVQGVHLDRTRAVAHVTIDPQATDAAALHEALRRAGYACACQEAGVGTPAARPHPPH